jgi:hypothetical protein
MTRQNSVDGAMGPGLEQMHPTGCSPVACPSEVDLQAPVTTGLGDFWRSSAAGRGGRRFRLVPSEQQGVGAGPGGPNSGQSRQAFP